VSDDDGNGVETQQAPGQWPPYPEPGEVRGTALAALLAQMLGQPYAAPSGPFLVEQAQSGLSVQ
jgi:hypothetical protein